MVVGLVSRWDVCCCVSVLLCPSVSVRCLSVVCLSVCRSVGLCLSVCAGRWFFEDLFVCLVCLYLLTYCMYE